MKVNFDLKEKKEGQVIVWSGIETETAWEYDDYMDHVVRFGYDGDEKMTEIEFRHSPIRQDFNRAVNLLPIK